MKLTSSILLSFCLGSVVASPAMALTAPANVANVYIQTTKGVDVYNANANGSLSLVKGSPFSTSGQMEGNNGGYLLSVGTNYLHSYKVAANGGVGAQTAEINTQSYNGADCGNTDMAGAVLDHTGKYFYVQLSGASYNGGEDVTCAAWQTYQIGSNGFFTFLGANDLGYSTDGTALTTSVPTFSSNDKFQYGTYSTAFASDYAPTQIDSAGVLEANSGFSNNSPAPSPVPAQSDNAFFPVAMAADPTGHLAVFMYEPFTSTYPLPPIQLASFTINGQGGIATTNAYGDMPVLTVTTGVPAMRMSPAGNILAAGGYPGLQLFHFNGAAAPTNYKTLIPTVDIDQVTWDNSNHLYALSHGSGDLYVFTATPTAVSQVAGSPFKVVGTPYGLKGLIVVPK